MKADIKEAFLQVELSEVDQVATRFLWINNLQEPMDVEKKIGCYRFRQMSFGAPPSPFPFGATLRHRVDKQKDDRGRRGPEELHVGGQRNLWS